MPNQLPDPSAAYNTLMQQVHFPVFFNRLAQYGIAPRNAKEATDLLDLAANVQAYKEKQAAAAPSRFAGIKQAMSGPADQTKAILPQLVARPDLYDSVLSLKAAAAARVQAGIDAQNQPAQAS